MKKPFTVRVVSVLLAVILCTLSMSLTAGAVEEGYELIGEVSGGLFTDTGASSGTNEYIIEDVQSGKTGKITATLSSTGVPDYTAGTVTETTAYQHVTGITSGSKYLFVFVSDSGHYVMNNTVNEGTLGTVRATDSAELQSTISGNFNSYLYTLTRSSSRYTVKSSADTYLNIGSSSLSLGSSSPLTFTSAGDYYTVRNRYSSYYLFFDTTDNTVVSSNTASYVYLYQENGTTSAYEVSTDYISELIAYADSLTSSRYTNWAALNIDGLVAAAQDALGAVSNPYSTEAGAQTAQAEVNTAAQALQTALAQFEPDTTQVLAEFRVTDDADYNGGSVSAPVKSGTKVSCTTTADDGSRFCYWTKNGAWYSSSAAITVEDGENDVYVAWFTKVQSDGSIIVPITWTRTDEQTTDSDGDGSRVVTGIDTYSDDNYTDYGVTWDKLKGLTTTHDPFVWDLNHSGTDGDNITYPYNQGKYTGFPDTKIGASWTDLDPDTSDNGWKKASARLFRGEFYWPEGYTTSDIIKMVSVNDADYAAIYDYINRYIATHSDDTAFASAFQGGTVLPINDDMFIFIHSAADDITTKTSGEALDYLTFFTGSTGKGVWTQVGNNSADWGKTTETKLGTAYSVRAFHYSYPNLVSDVADDNDTNIKSMDDTTEIYTNLKHTDGWYTVLNTSTLASRLGSVYGVDTSFPAGTLFYFDIYVLDNDGAGGMDKWELNFKKADRSVTVNYYYDTIADTNFLGSATITGKVTGDSITLTSGTSAAQLDYYYAAATAHAGNDEIYLSGVQQGTVPYVVTAGENVINVLYIKVAKNALNFVSAGGRYTYDGTEKTASGISLYYDGVLVNPTGSNTWNVTAYGYTYTVTYNGGSSVTAKYVGTTVNDIDETLVSIRQNGVDASLSFETVYTEGTLQIVPANVAFIYDYGVTNNYTDTANIPSGSVFAEGGVYWKMLTGNGEKTTSVTYTPTGIYNSGDAAENNSRALDINGDDTDDMTVTFLPATTVYYEDTFITPGDGWSTYGTAAGSTVYPDGMYGYGKGYEDDNGYSDGTCLTTVASGKIDSRTTASFTFTGTGFTVHGKTDSESGLLRIYVKNASTQKWVKVITVDALFVKDAYNGVPLATVSGLDYGTYEVTLKAYTAKEIYTKDPAATERGRIRIDGITVYEAIKKDGSGAATTALANLARDAYSRDGELNCEIFDMRDVYLSDKITDEIKAGSSYYINGVWVPNVFTSAAVGSASADNGIAAFLIDKDASGSGYTVAEIVEFGPKNELYIQPNQSLTLVITGKTFDKLTAEISSPTGNSIDFSVNTAHYTVTSTVHMYYPAVTNTAGAEITVVITNNSADVLSVSSVKITNVGSAASAADETSLDEVLIYAAAVNGFVTSGGIHGDVNANGAVDPADYLMIKRSILGTYTLTPVQSVAADANTDTEVNATDYLAVKRIFLGTYTAD
ncbi:MAG: dockerin type I domain-containing protein [Clostridiales bacterium]|nr:dockerin type I domain-containing protein [Clostridiales bacterium]